MLLSKLSRALVILPWLVFAIAIGGCGGDQLSRGRASKLIAERDGLPKSMSLPLPVGDRVTVALIPAGNVKALVQLEVVPLYRLLAERELITMSRVGPLQGWHGGVDIYNIALTEKGEDILGNSAPAKVAQGFGSATVEAVSVPMCVQNLIEVSGIKTSESGKQAEVEYVVAFTDPSEYWGAVDSEVQSRFPVNTKKTKWSSPASVDG
jgi:hypothetical protein